MTSKISEEAFFTSPRRTHGGRTFVYVLRCEGEDLLKVGFTHDPVARFRTLHPKFYTFFDLNESLLVETETLKEARRIERLFIERWPEHRAPAPIEINPRAGGHSEWFRGVGDAITAVIERMAERYGHHVHAPLRDWLHHQFLERADLLFAWSERIYQIIDWQEQNQPIQMRDPVYANGLRNALRALEAVGINDEQWVPESVHRWYLAKREAR